jgi:hypothetical protein
MLFRDRAEDMRGDEDDADRAHFDSRDERVSARAETMAD